MIAVWCSRPGSRGALLTDGDDSNMRLRSLTLLYGLLALLLQSGCTSSANVQAAKLESVRAGMTRDEVLEIIGPPQRQEIYGPTEFLIYSSDGTSTTALLDFIPIALVDGRVTGTGRSLYEAVVRAHSKYPPPR
jgi:hypothetical protein